MDEAGRLWIRGLLAPKVRLGVAGVGPLQFRAGWGIGPRAMPQHILHAILAGGTSGTVDGRPIACRPDDLLWIPAGLNHHLHQDGQRTLRFWRLRIAIDGLPGAPAEPRLWRGLGHAASLLADACTPPLIDARLRAALVLLLDRPGGRVGAEASDAPWWPAVEAYLARSGTQGSISGMASAAGVGVRHLTRCCAARLGVPPRTLLVQRRCRRAADALADGASVAQAASLAGWGDPYLFSRMFHRHIGMTPSRWRRLSLPV